MILINGNPAETIAATDRGLAYGDGCFTTGRVRRGRLQLEQAHLDRLWQACERLFITPPEREQLQDEIRQQASLLHDGVLKVLLTRGSGGRGYSTQGCDTTLRMISTSVWPAHYTRWQQQGIVLGESNIPLACHPLLAGIKHLNRLEQVLIRRQIDQQGWDEAT
ncbi:MAG: aminodeoxychorismate lyase, partial [Plesiomonas sp.]